MSSTNKFDLSGKSAIITGSGSGIGRAMALTFAEAGATVLVNDIIAERAHETVKLIGDAGGQAVAAVADISDQKAVEGFVADAVARWGKIDILCNNAGIMDLLHGPEATETEMWNRVMEVNATGTFIVTRAVIPHMIARKSGVIVNTASLAGLRGGCAGTAYVASKHAVVGLTKSTAWMHAENGIRCNAICPGGTETNIMNGAGMEIFDPVGFARAVPVMTLGHRITGPQVMADTALFLVSDAAAFLNGAIIPVDGGWMAG